MEKTSENTSTNKLITIKKRVKARLTSISPEIVKKDYKMTPLPRIKENDTHRKSRTESDNALNFIKKELTSSMSNLNTKQCFCASVSEISDEDYARISRLTERNKNHDCRPCHLSRDVSHTKDRPDRLNKLYDRDRSDLVQTLGLADVNIESLQLPTELDKLKEMLNHENKGNQAPNMIKASHSPLKNEIYNMNDFYHEKFIKDLDVIKRKSNKYLETKTISIAKEGGFLFKTQSGLIQPKHTQISDEKIPHKVSTRSKSIGNSEKTKINLDAKLN